MQSLRILNIFRTLLFKLVEKSLSSKHPQLMLRRTESIVEKMLTNWLALAMYDYMRDYAGSSLFVLFKAIKFQVGVVSSAPKSSIRRFVITEKAPTRAFSWLKAATTAFTFKTLLRHYAKWALTPRSLNVKLGP